MKRTIYAIGAKFIEKDNLALKVGERLKDKFDIHIVETPDSIDLDNPCLIIDVVEGVKEPTIINDMNRIVSCSSVTCHDIDLGFFIKLRESLGEKSDVLVLGIPLTGELDELTRKVMVMLNKLKDN
ncbi:hypothetical protein JW868_02070 [Candidatus Woesearchaeota archaeon]|nr:hypothetical protein [Candidatus Woesearchaeota archaeon]